MRAVTPLLVSWALAAAGPGVAAGQSAVSVEAGALVAYDEALAQLGFRVARLKNERAGVDFALALLPDAIASGVFMFLADLDLGFPVPLSRDVVLAPRFGASLIAAAGEGGAGGAVGYNVGAGVVARASPALGVRIDYTHRRAIGDGVSPPFSSISFGIVWIH